MDNDKKGDVRDLRDKEAIEKIQQLAGKENVCLFTTRLSQVPLTARPMSTQDVDEQGNLWFMSAKSSDKNEQIKEDNRVQLFYSNKGSSEFLSIYGTAEIIVDREKIEALWNPIAKAWFKEGKNDPEITLIKITPEAAYYWDTKNSKAIDFLKIVASAVSGKTLDGGIEGRIKTG